MWFSKQKKENKEPEEFNILAYDKLPAMSLLNKLFSFESSIYSAPRELTKEVLRRINPLYCPKGVSNGMVAVGGEGCVLHAFYIAEGKENDVCVKIVRPQYNLTMERPSDMKQDDWILYQEALHRFKERFYKGIQNQRLLVLESKDVSFFGFPKVLGSSIDWEIRRVELKNRIKKLNEAHDKSVLPSKREEIRDKIEEIKEEIAKIRTPFIYMEMEWIDGPLILQWLRDKKDVIYRLGKYCDLLKAIEFMHRNKIIHRDLKSSNIMISGETEEKSIIWVVDHTFSKKEDGQTFTVAGEGIGTAPYASPQQLALGNALDAGKRDDVCSLGFMLIEFFHAVYLPSPSSSDLQDFKKRQAYIQACATCLPDQLRSIFLKATAFDPEKRYSSVEKLEDEIIHAIAEIRTKGFECFEMRDPVLYINSMIQSVGRTESEITIIDQNIDVDLCLTCDVKAEVKDICAKYHFCELMKKAYQESR